MFKENACSETSICSIKSWNKIMMTPQQQLPTIIMDKSNPTTMREELIIISIRSLTITPTPRHIITSNENCKKKKKK